MSHAMTIRTEPINEDCVVVTLDGRLMPATQTQRKRR